MKPNFLSGHYGVMEHFLGSTAESDERWNERVDAFDVQALARQLHEVGASWLIFTVSQCGGRFCMPLASIEKISPHACSRRDLVADLIAALRPYGIGLVLYAAAEGLSIPTC